jgi:DNA polymerase V
MNPSFFHTPPGEGGSSRPSAAADFSAPGIDLNEQLIRNAGATFVMQVNSGAMAAAGIAPGDVVIVDRALEPANGKLIIAALDGELLIRRLEIHNGKKRLTAGGLAAIDVDESRFSCWGVVTYVIRRLG